MRNFGIGCLVVCLILGVIGIGVVGTVIGALGNEASLRSEVEAHEKAREASLDTMKKIITQKTQLPAAAKADLLKLLPEVVSGRSGGMVFKSVQENYPEFTLDLYKDISRSIEAERHTFLNEQKELFDVAREYNSLVRSPISGSILKLFGRGKEIDVQVISSTESKEIVRTGIDDNTDLGLTPKSPEKD